jgi:hypothetical protein
MRITGPSDARIAAARRPPTEKDVPIVPPSVVVLLRGVAPSTWSACQRVLGAVREVAAAPVTLLVAPRLEGQPHDARFDAALSRRLALGDELALHGYMHDDGGRRSSAPHGAPWRDGAAEFAGLCCDDALQRLHAGMRWFDANGWPLAGFVAPRWQLGPGAWEALRLTPLRYTATRDALHALRPGARGDRLPSYGIEHRTGGAWARAASLAWNALPGRLGQDTAPLVRLELTPDAADHVEVRHAWQACLHRHLCYRHAHTLARVLQLWQGAPQRVRRPAAAPLLRPARSAHGARS